MFSNDALQTVVDSFNAGNWDNLIGSMMILFIANYATVVVTGAIKAVKALINEGKLALDAYEGHRLDDVNDKIAQKICDAVDAVAPIADDLKAIAANGKLSGQDIIALQEKAFELFWNSLGIKDLLNFALAYIPGFSPSTSSKELSNSITVRDELKKRFIGWHVKAVEEAKLLRSGDAGKMAQAKEMRSLRRKK